MRLAPAAVFIHGHDFVVQWSGSGSHGAWRYGQHDHDGWCELVLVQRGVVVQIVGGVRHELRPGMAMLIRADDVHAVEGHGCRFYNLAIAHREWHRLHRHLGDDLPLAQLDNAAQPPSARLPPLDYERALADLELLLHRQHLPGGRHLLLRALLHVVPHLLTPDMTHHDTGPTWLAPLLTECTPLVDRLDTRALARRAGCSPEHLARTFRAHLDTTPSAWINQRRIERAAALLSRSDVPITTLAHDLGLGSASYLTRLFRERFRCSPRVYRQRHRLPVGTSL